MTATGRVLIVDDEPNALKVLSAILADEGYQVSQALSVSDAFAKILKADDANVWVLYNNKLLVLQYKKQKLLQTIDLQSWLPHQAVLDGNRLWLISKNDGLLYGLTL